MAAPAPELLGLFIASFAAATLLPMPSEIALYAYLQLHPGDAELALTVATVGNTAGGMTTYFLARLLPDKAQSKMNPRAVDYLRRFGAPVAMLSWLPVVGDALTAAAGWLRLRWWVVLAFMATGRLARYAVVVYVIS